MTDKKNPLGPLTLEEAEKWLHFLEDTATIERDLGFATRLVLAHLLKQLDEQGIFDSKKLLKDLMRATPTIEEANSRVGAEALIPDLLRIVAGKKAPYSIH